MVGVDPGWDDVRYQLFSIMLFKLLVNKSSSPLNIRSFVVHEKKKSIDCRDSLANIVLVMG